MVFNSKELVEVEESRFSETDEEQDGCMQALEDVEGVGLSRLQVLVFVLTGFER